VTFGSVVGKRGQRVVIYGTGGIGKTTLTALLETKNAWVDADESLPILRSQLEEINVTIPVTVPATNWETMISSLKADGWDGVDNIILDTGTKIEEWCLADMLRKVPHPDKGTLVRKIEDYGYGKGYQYLFEHFMPLLTELDRHCRQGRNVVIICHDCTASVPNPEGEDWLRYEPRLQSPATGKASIRLRVKEWADHVLFLGYDIAVDKSRKAQGSGTRTLYTTERPFCMAKSRTTDQEFIIEKGVSPWYEIIK
jgi:hypothetical protein